MTRHSDWNVSESVRYGKVYLKRCYAWFVIKTYIYTYVKHRYVFKNQGGVEVSQSSLKYLLTKKSGFYLPTCPWHLILSQIPSIFLFFVGDFTSMQLECCGMLCKKVHINIQFESLNFYLFEFFSLYECLTPKMLAFRRNSRKTRMIVLRILNGALRVNACQNVQKWCPKWA